MHFRITSRFQITILVCLALTFAAVLPVTSYWLRITSSAETAPFLDEQDFVRQVDLPANDLVVDPNMCTLTLKFA